MGSYLRPLALLHGRDGRDAVAAGRAGALAGSNWLAFTAAEIITRQNGAISRQVTAYGDLPKGSLLAAIEAPRAPIVGRPLGGRPLVMGIVNVTPDSFSDGGLAFDAKTAIAHGLALAGEGAEIVDVGGESTRPGSAGVAEAEELSRIAPVIEGLARAGLTVSCDTRKAAVMRQAVAAGAVIINDVSALQFDRQARTMVAELGCPVVLMHAQGEPRTMQLQPRYDDAALDVYDQLEARVAEAVAAGVARDRIVIDPGIGFGKTFQHNLELLQQLPLFHGLGLPLLVGLSRKGFLGALTGETVPASRVNGSLGGALHAALNGAQILRVHDVKATVAALAVALAAVDPPSGGW